MSKDPKGLLPPMPQPHSMQFLRDYSEGQMQAYACLAISEATQAREPSDEAILHRWDTHVGDPNTKYPLTDADKIGFARAVIALAARATQEPSAAPQHAAEALTLSDEDMDAVLRAIADLNSGDLGFHGFCDRITALARQAGTVGEPKEVKNKFGDSLIELAKERAHHTKDPETFVIGVEWACKQFVHTTPVGEPAPADAAVKAKQLWETIKILGLSNEKLAMQAIRAALAPTAGHAAAPQGEVVGWRYMVGSKPYFLRTREDHFFSLDDGETFIKGEPLYLATQPAAPAVPKPLDDPRLQEMFSAAIDGALTSGYQGVAPAPAGHWLGAWWQRGRDVALQAAPAVQGEREAFESAMKTMEGFPFAGAYANLMWKAWQLRAVLATQPAAQPVQPEAMTDAVRAIIECYADSYATMWRIDGGKVQCNSVEADLRLNILPQVLAAIAATGKGAKP